MRVARAGRSRPRVGDHAADVGEGEPGLIADRGERRLVRSGAGDERGHVGRTSGKRDIHQGRRRYHERAWHGTDRGVGVADEEIASTVRDQGYGVVQPAARDGGDGASRGTPLFDRVGSRLGDVNVARAIHRQARRTGEAVAYARDDGRSSRRACRQAPHPPGTEAVAIKDINVVQRIDGDSARDAARKGIQWQDIGQGAAPRGNNLELERGAPDGDPQVAQAVESHAAAVWIQGPGYVVVHGACGYGKLLDREMLGDEHIAIAIEVCTTSAGDAVGSQISRKGIRRCGPLFHSRRREILAGIERDVEVASRRERQATRRIGAIHRPAADHHRRHKSIVAAGLCNGNRLPTDGQCAGACGSCVFIHKEGDHLARVAKLTATDGVQP